MPELSPHHTNQNADPIDQTEIDKEIEALLSDNSEQPAKTPKVQLKDDDYRSKAVAMDLTIGSTGISDDTPAVSKPSKLYAARHPFAMLLTLLVAAGGMAAIFFVSLKVGTCMILASLCMHLACLCFLDGKKLKLLLLICTIILGCVVYFSLPKTKCCDGTYSYSTGSGTCSYHGGMAKNGCEYRAKCCDGTYTTTKGAGACAHHGGLAKNGHCNR